MTEGVGFTSFLVSACRVKVAQRRLAEEHDNDDGNNDNNKSQLLGVQEAYTILQWEYPIITHPACLKLLSDIMDSLAKVQEVPSLEMLYSKGYDAWDFLLSPGSIKRIAMRSKFIDHYMLNSIATAPSLQQIVVLGAGMDTRPFRLPLSPTIHYFEIDLPSVMDFKKSLFSSSKLPSHISLIGSDLMDPIWMTHLKSEGFNSSIPTLWILEGLVMYLPDKSVVSLLKDLSSLSSPDSHILLHTVNCKEVESNQPSTTSPAESPSDILSNLGAKMVFGVDEPAALISALNDQWQDIVSYNYQQIASTLNCQDYLTDLITNSTFTTAVVK